MAAKSAPCALLETAAKWKIEPSIGSPINPEIQALILGNRDRIQLNLNHTNPMKQELYEFLRSRVLGQEVHLEVIAKLVASRLQKIGIRKGPLAVVYLAGPTGVGKTETAHALAEFFLRDPEGVTVICGEDFQNRYTSRNLFGSPKTYVGYGDVTPLNDIRLYAPLKEAQNTGNIHESVAKSERFSIVVINEADKIHPSILQNFLWIFDKGEFEFPTGSEEDENISYSRVTNFRETVFILTSNLGEQEKELHSHRQPMGFSAGSNEKKKRNDEIVSAALKEKFSPEFRSRIDCICNYDVLSQEAAEGVVRRAIENYRTFAQRRYGKRFSIDIRPEVIRAIALSALSLEKGGREIGRIAETQVFDPIEGVFLSGDLAGIPECLSATIRISGDHFPFEGTLENLRENVAPNNNSSLQASRELPTVERILDVARKIEVYQRLCQCLLTEPFTLKAEVARLENELSQMGVPRSEIETISERAKSRVIIPEESLPKPTEEEILGDRMADATKLFYPISPEAIMTIVQHFSRNSEIPLMKPQMESMRIATVLQNIKETCKVLLGSDLTKDQSDYIGQAFHHLYLSYKGRIGS